ncbi:hypothetical protein LUZ62_052651 [Rhynchospora pubera]|uniref:Uncharacterized protein n=1 Tax=Rhynchospora pubera TaxID=906938 RepID=A0AAV8GCK3_9POAL|nr:hypothetical protein LUZ62_052651 [Rhynchospora pubera]
MILKRHPFSYSRVDKVHDEEEQHRKAQILINKILNEIDSVTRRPTPLRLKAARVAVKVGVRMKKVSFAARRMRFWLLRRIDQYFRPSTLRLGY